MDQTDGQEGGGDPEVVCPEDPEEGPVPPECGLWVSAVRGDDANPGTAELPVRTLGKGIQLARGLPNKPGPGKVYVCGGEGEGERYAESITLPSGIGVHGGFDCTEDWVYLGTDRRAVLAPTAPGAVVITVTDGERQSLISDVLVEAPDAVGSGASAIAVFAMPGSKSVIRRSLIFSGNGVDGEPGDNASPDGAAAPDGLSGNDGAYACTAEPGLGGAAVTLDCGGESTAGGAGGHGGELFANDGQHGEISLLSGGKTEGGQAEDAALGTPCTGGATGLAGAHGTNGLGGLGDGRLTELGYFGEAGVDGTPGEPGQGGGGGGGSTGNATCGMLPHGGAGGGSGGSGGCGGHAGTGGQPGGASIGVAARGAVVFLDDTTIYTGIGGHGGHGGTGQLGGQAGLPGLGGLGFGAAGGVSSACAGGAGGNGGNGGGGGGGHGGHSVGIAATPDAMVAWISAPRVVLGKSGAGGAGFGAFETSGEDGALGDVVLLNL